MQAIGSSQLLSYPELHQNVHLGKLRDYYGAFECLNSEIKTSVNISFLCYTNRCGSSYIAELFASGGNYNRAQEYFNWDAAVSHSDAYEHHSFQSYFSWIVENFSCSDHIFIKLGLPHLDLLGRSGILQQIFPQARFLMVSRNDRLGQAISTAIAFGTGKFTSQLDGHKSANEVAYDRKLLDDIIDGIAKVNMEFDLFFGRNGITATSLIYEQVLASPQNAINRALSEVGLQKLRIDPNRLSLKRQADHVTAEWRRRYLFPSLSKDATI